MLIVGVLLRVTCDWEDKGAVSSLQGQIGSRLGANRVKTSKGLELGLNQGHRNDPSSLAG